MAFESVIFLMVLDSGMSKNIENYLCSLFLVIYETRETQKPCLLPEPDGPGRGLSPPLPRPRLTSLQPRPHTEPEPELRAGGEHQC